MKRSSVEDVLDLAFQVDISVPWQFVKWAIDRDLHYHFRDQGDEILVTMEVCGWPSYEVYFYATDDQGSKYALIISEHPVINSLLLARIYWVLANEMPKEIWKIFRRVIALRNPG